VCGQLLFKRLNLPSPCGKQNYDNDDDERDALTMELHDVKKVDHELTKKFMYIF